jgi:fatty-acid desaturase
VRLFFMLFGAMTIQNSIYIWAAGHRPHHRFVDDEDLDPYSSRRGMWFSHIGWMLRSYASGVPDFKYVKDLERDPIVMFQHRHYVPLVLAMNIALPLLVGALSGDVWGTLMLAGVLRLVVNHHVTFFINSLAHGWGHQPYTDQNTSRDNPVLAFFTYGEGYHNFHHLFASDYRNGIRWWQWDPTKWLIRAMSMLGLASKLRVHAVRRNRTGPPRHAVQPRAVERCETQRARRTVMPRNCASSSPASTKHSPRHSRNGLRRATRGSPRRANTSPSNSNASTSPRTRAKSNSDYARNGVGVERMLLIAQAQNA